MSDSNDGSANPDVMPRPVDGAPGSTAMTSAERAKLKRYVRWGVGCGAGGMVLLILFFVLGYYVTSSFRDELKKELDGFSAQGYEMMQQETIRIDAPLPGKKLLNGNRVFINADCPAGVVIYANECTINAPVTGAILIRGGRLILGSKAVLASLKGDVQEFASQGVVQRNELIVGDKAVDSAAAKNDVGKP